MRSGSIGLRGKGKIRALTVLQAVVLALIVGYATAAYAAPGDLDTTFSADGKLTTKFGPGHDEVQDVAVQQDGKIVVAGYTHNTNGNGTVDFALARYNPSGTLDASFDGDGKLTTPIGSGDDHARALVIQADGKIVVAGSSSGNFALVRYNSDGTLDTSFGNSGKVTTDFGSPGEGANAITIQGDDKIVVAGAFNYDDDFALARYNPGGTLDTTFDTDGRVITDFGSSQEGANALAVQGDGKILVAGYALGPTSEDFALARYNADGSPDTGFDTDGKIMTDFGDWDSAQAVVVKDDGSIFAVGSTANQIASNFALARYDENGNLVGSFGVGGKVETNFNDDLQFGSDDSAFDLKIQPDGKLVVAGRSDGDFALTRYGPSGALDNTFSGDGKFTTDFGDLDSAYALAVQPDGRLVAAGSARIKDSSGDYYQDFAASRYYGGSDTSAPKVTKLMPPDGATGVSLGANVAATFSDTMDPATVSTTTFKLFKKGTTTPVGATVKYAPAVRKAILDPKNDLRAGATYKAVVVGGGKGAKDESGNPLLKSKTWSFTIKR